ncbi:UNVERIFIED_CONTAM: LysR family transcriptional regulator [Kocuria sp. CPCC 205316]|uniref:LysR family transcriptional regulator n=1 Tax=Kocuria TaxID=57493 RepID=UPI0036D9389F
MGARVQGNLLRWLEYFVAVAEAGHVGRAAEKLGIAQPPLSQTIRRLEHSVGITLFIRHARGVRLTPEGEQFLTRAYGVLEAQSQLLGLRAELESSAPVVTVRVPALMPSAWVAELAAGWSAVATAAEPHASAATRLRFHTQTNSTMASATAADPDSVGLFIAPAITGPLTVHPVVAIPQYLVSAAEPDTVSSHGAVPRSLSRRDVRRTINSPVALTPRREAPAAFDLRNSELTSLGVTVLPPVREYEQEREALGDAVQGHCVLLRPHLEPMPGLVFWALPAGILPLRLRVAHCADATAMTRSVAGFLHHWLSNHAAYAGS